MHTHTQVYMHPLHTHTHKHRWVALTWIASADSPMTPIPTQPLTPKKFIYKIMTVASQVPELLFQ